MFDFPGDVVEWVAISGFSGSNEVPLFFEHGP